MTWKKFSMEQAAARFDASEDFTIGIEEEFQIIDPETLALTGKFEEVHKAAHPVLGPNVAGELIASEIEINTRKCRTLTEAEDDLREKRRALMEAAGKAGVRLAASGTHPFSDWKDQRILSTAHYREVEERLRYCVWRTLAYGMHVHVGLSGRDRMISIFNAMRGYLPHLLALSANSPFAEERYTYLHSTRAQIFTRSFPRSNIPAPFRDWDDYSSLINLLFATHSVGDPMQIWWSIRPHPWLGTVEIRICDCQGSIEETMAVASLAVALIKQLADDFDHGKQLPSIGINELDENLWRGLRYGLDGKMVDFEAEKETPTPDAIRALIDYSEDQWAKLGAARYLEDIYRILREGNGAQRQIRLFEKTGSIKTVFMDVVERSRFD